MTGPREPLPRGVQGWPIAGRRQLPRWRGPQPVPPQFYDSHRAREAMARRDVHEVYRILGAMGVSQRRIAALTGQSQSEVHEVRSGRVVRAVDLLERIADGLATPRGWWGLAHADTDRPVEPPQPPAEPSTRDALLTLTDLLAEHLPARPGPQWVPAARPAGATPAEAAVGRHLVGLIRALRASLAPRAAVMRPARHTAPHGRLRRPARHR